MSSVCIAVASGKGGVGKSALTANLGAALTLYGKRVLIIDTDIGLRSQDALLALENQVVYDLIDLTEGECVSGQAILSCEAFPALHLLPAAQFSRVKALEPKRFRIILDSLRNSYDYILIDCPAGIERGLRNVLNTGVDELILVTTPDDISLRSVERARQLAGNKSIEDIRLIVNRLDECLIRAGEMMSAITASQLIDLPLLGEIPEDPAVYRAVFSHRLFLEFDCPARTAVMHIASRLTGLNVPFPLIGAGKRTFFRRNRYKPLREVIPLDDH